MATQFLLWTHVLSLLKPAVLLNLHVLWRKEDMIPRECELRDSEWKWKLKKKNSYIKSIKKPLDPQALFLSLKYSFLDWKYGFCWLGMKWFCIFPQSSRKNPSKDDFDFFLYIVLYSIFAILGTLGLTR